MDLQGAVESASDRVEHAATRGPDPDSIARVSLAAMLLAAGAHKLLDPGAWTVYVVDWLAPWLVVSPVAFMLVNGLLEVGFGALLLADRWTAVAAVVAAVSLTATAVYLALVWAMSGAFGDVFARDLGLAGLAWAVLSATLRRNNRSQGPRAT